MESACKKAGCLWGVWGMWGRSGDRQAE
jgi:hypothetical protein